MKSLIVLPVEATTENTTISHAVRFLERHLPQPVDVLHADHYDEKRHSEYAHAVYAGRADQLRKILGEEADVPQLQGDAYCCRAISKSPTVLYLAAGNDRGVQYAAGELCRAIRLGRDLSTVDIEKRPRVPLRMAYMCASTNNGGHFRPGLFDDSLEKLAFLGANGVFIIPEKGYGTPAGMEGLPFHFEDAQLVSVEPRVKEWQYMLDRIQSYGHEIYMMISAWIPPDLEMQAVRDYYDGKIDIPDYETRAAQTMKTMLSTIFERFPHVSGVVLHSLERSDLWSGSVSIFPTGDLERTAAVMDTYLSVVRDCCQLFGKTPCFWPHVFGVDGRQLIGLRKILEQYPEIVNLEDSYWNNSGWPFLPIMGYLPDDLRKTIHRKSRFGMFTTSTDAEYYGNGALPALHPKQLHEASREAAEREADTLIFRVHREDRTPFGTLDNICGINVEASLRALWTPEPDLKEIWHEWSCLRFGRAGNSVAQALILSREILLKGITYKGAPFMFHGSIPAHQWKPGSMNFRLFGKPGVPLLEKPYEDLQGIEFQYWQAGVESIPIMEFRSAQDEACRAVVTGRTHIEDAKPNLTQEDYDYLVTMYASAETVLKAIRLTGEATYAMNLVEENFDHHPDPVTLARDGIRQLRLHAQDILQKKGKKFFCAPYYMKACLNDEEITAPSLGESLLVIAETYQSSLNDAAADSMRENNK